MKLTVELIKRRYEYWLEEIAKAGIWDASKFDDIVLKIGRRSKNHNGYFCQVTYRDQKGQVVKVEDMITINSALNDVPLQFLDDLIVHEMIHQYIKQNNLKDNRPHGRRFKKYMDAINHAFTGRLSIKVKENMPEQKGKGSITHTILVLKEAHSRFLCVVNADSIRKFDLRLRYRRNEFKHYIMEHWWAESEDLDFGNWPVCRERLSGRRFTPSEFKKYMERHPLRRISVV